MAIQGPQYGSASLCTLKTSDAFLPGVKVYLVDGADTQTVSVTDPGASGHTGNYVGLYDGPAIASAAAGQVGPVKIGCRYPAGNGGVLQF